MDKITNFQTAILKIENILYKTIDDRLEKEKRKLEKFIRENPQLLENDMMKSYDRFFKPYGKTYPIRFQIESIIKGKSFPARSCILEAMFMAELKNQVLTAAHDLDRIKGELTTLQATGSENYENINGKNMQLKEGDFFTKDEDGIISSVLFGPDSRTKVTETTRNFLFFAYCPDGCSEGLMQKHFDDIVHYMRIFDNNAITEKVSLTHKKQNI